MGKRDRLWKKLWVLALCGVMAMEPAVACAEEPAEAWKKKKRGTSFENVINISNALAVSPKELL